MRLDAYDVITLVALSVVLAGDLTFIVVQHMWTSWRSNPWGRHVMAFSYVIAAILCLSLARVAFGDYAWRKLLVTAFYCAFAVLMWQRVWLVVREHRHRGRRRR